MARERVLIVEDSPTQRVALARDLQEAGFEVTAATSAEEALDALEQALPGLVLTDVVMPGMDGFELCRVIRSRDPAHETPVVILTQLHHPEDVLRGLDAGADAFLVKPHDPDELTAQIEYLLANRSLRRLGRPEGELSIELEGRRYTLGAGRLQLLDALLSMYAGLRRQMQEKTRALEAAEAARRRAEEAARQVEDRNRQLRLFTGAASHDMKAPLRIIRGFLESILSDLGEELPEEARSRLEKVLAASGRMQHLLDRLLELSRLETLELRPQPVRLDRVLRQVLGLHAQELEAAGGTLAVDVDDVAVLADGDLLASVLGNLISNAVRYSAATGPPAVRVRARGTGREVRIEVEDNGPGIPPEHRERVFEPFQRLVSREEVEGTGLGLTIVRRACELLGGNVTLEAAEPSGCRFVVTLPACEAP